MKSRTIFIYSIFTMVLSLFFLQSCGNGKSQKKTTSEKEVKTTKKSHLTYSKKNVISKKSFVSKENDIKKTLADSMKTPSEKLISQFKYSGEMVKASTLSHQNGDFFLVLHDHTSPDASWQKIRGMVIETWNAKKSKIHKDILLTHGLVFSYRKGTLKNCKIRSAVYGGLTPVRKPSTHQEVESIWIEYPIDSSPIEIVFECGNKDYTFKIELTHNLKKNLLAIHNDIKKLIENATEKTKKMEDLLDRTFPITPLATDGSVSKNVKKIIELRNHTMVASFVLTMLNWQLNSLEKKKIAPTLFKVKLKRFAEKEYKYNRTKLVIIRRYIELAIKTNKKPCIKLRNRLKTMKSTEYEYGRLERKYGKNCIIYDAAEKDLFEISPLFEFIEKRRKGWLKFEF